MINKVEQAGRLSLIWRSIVFNVLFYAYGSLTLIIMLPVLLMPWRLAYDLIVKIVITPLFWLHRVIIGVSYELTGDIPTTTVIFAAQHQSLWETVYLMKLLPRPAFFYKKSLGLIPFLGWYIVKLGMIPVNRGKGLKTMRSMTRHARKRLQQNQSLLIFPEGTRATPGNKIKLRFGVAYLYQQLKIDCVPIALNSGLVWPRRQFTRYPGVISVAVLPPLAQGLEPGQLLDKLFQSLTTESDKLVAYGLSRMPNQFADKMLARDTKQNTSDQLADTSPDG